MSAALDSLNSILKYSQAREQQKIDRSLSLLDLGTKLKQQELDRNERKQRLEFDRRRLELTEAAEKERAEIRSIEKERLLDPKSAPKTELEEAQLEKAKLELSLIKQKEIENSTEEMFVALNNDVANTEKFLYGEIRSSKLIPEQIYSYIESNWDGRETDLKKSIINSTINDAQEKEVKNFLKRKESQPIINSLIYLQASKKSGSADYTPFLRVFDNLSSDSQIGYFSGDNKELNRDYDKYKESVQEILKTGDFYKEEENKIKIIKSLTDFSSKKVNKEFDSFLKEIDKKQEGANRDSYFSIEERRLLLNEINPATGKLFTPEEAGLR